MFVRSRVQIFDSSALASSGQTTNSYEPWSIVSRWAAERKEASCKISGLVYIQQPSDKTTTVWQISSAHGNKCSHPFLSLDDLYDLWDEILEKWDDDWIYISHKQRTQQLWPAIKVTSTSFLMNSRCFTNSYAKRLKTTVSIWTQWWFTYPLIVKGRWD